MAKAHVAVLIWSALWFLYVLSYGQHEINEQQCLQIQSKTENQPKLKLKHFFLVSFQTISFLSLQSCAPYSTRSQLQPFVCFQNSSFASKGRRKFQRKLAEWPRRLPNRCHYLWSYCLLLLRWNEMFVVQSRCEDCSIQEELYPQDLGLISLGWFHCFSTKSWFDSVHFSLIAIIFYKISKKKNQSIKLRTKNINLFIPR